MRTRLILRTTAWALALIGLLGTATLAGQKDRRPTRVVVQDRIVCDENDDDCEGVVVEVDGNPSVFYVGDNTISAPRFAFSFGASGGYLGVSLVDLTPELRDHFGVPDDLGVMIGRVEQDTTTPGANRGSNRRTASALNRLRPARRPSRRTRHFAATGFR